MNDIPPSPVLPDPPVVIEPRGQADACVIWLHGLGADGHDFEPVVPVLGLHAGHRIRFVFPHAPMQPVTINQGTVMRAWYDIRLPNLLEEVDREGMQRSMAVAAALVREQAQAGIPSKRIILAGFSQGGAIALQAGLGEPGLVGGIIALSTYLPMPDLLTEPSPPASVFMAHGRADPLIPLNVARHSFQLLEKAGCSAAWHEYPMPHSVCNEELHDIGNWLEQALGPL